MLLSRHLVPYCARSLLVGRFAEFECVVHRNRYRLLEVGDQFSVELIGGFEANRVCLDGECQNGVDVAR